MLHKKKDRRKLTEQESRLLQDLENKRDKRISLAFKKELTMLEMLHSKQSKGEVLKDNEQRLLSTLEENFSEQLKAE